MGNAVKIGIIICDRYKGCAGGKCLRALRERAGAFSIYAGEEVELAGFTSCGGCPGGNVEHAGEEMQKNGVSVVHLATGLVVGYPPCPHIDTFKRFMEERFGFRVVIGTHPIPAKYLKIHDRLGTWDTPEWRDRIQLVMTDEETRSAYD
jgi:predicted metal-binding protein